MTPNPATREALLALEKLSAPQRKALGALDKAEWTTIKALNRRKLVAIRVCFPDGDGVVLTPLGLQVCALAMGEGAV